jgi:hypothetical protein
MEILERQAVLDTALAAKTGLHAVPPAVIRPREADDQLAARVEAGQPDRRHDRLGAAHVERHLVEPGDLTQARDVVGDDGVQRSQHGPQLAYPLEPLRHPVLVPLDARDVDPIPAADIERPVTVQVPETRALRRRDHRRQVEMLAHKRRERIGHPRRIGEAQVGKPLAVRVAPRGAPRILCSELLCQGIEPISPALHPLVGSAIGAEEVDIRVAPGFHPA